MFRKLFAFRSIVPEPVLGRWTRTCEKTNSIKIFWANVDHCGTCSGDAVAVKKNIVPKKLLPPPAVKGIR